MMCLFPGIFVLLLVGYIVSKLWIRYKFRKGAKPKKTKKKKKGKKVAKVGADNPTKDDTTRDEPNDEEKPLTDDERKIKIDVATQIAKIRASHFFLASIFLFYPAVCSKVVYILQY